MESDAGNRPRKLDETKPLGTAEINPLRASSRREVYTGDAAINAAVLLGG